MEIPDITWLPKIEEIKLPEKLIALALQSMSDTRPRSWATFPSKDGSVSGANLSSNLKALLIHPQVKPPAIKIVIIDITSNRVFLPTERMEDLLDVVRQVYSPLLSTIVVFNEFCIQNFGLTQKKVPPVRLASNADFSSTGLDQATITLPSSSNESIWWQRFGGELFLVNYADTSNEHFFKRQTIANRVGKFEKLPTWVLR